MKKFELSLTKEYANTWGVQEALREILQNAKDQETVLKGNNMSVTYDKKNSILRISNKKSLLTKKSLLLGHTTKRDDDKLIGQFGEGLKLGLLVLTRENKPVTIYNYGNREIWSPKFVKSRRYEGADILTIFVDTKFIWQKTPDNDLTIEIKNISEEEYLEMKDRSLFLQKQINTLKSDKLGEILLEDKFKGKIFVNGLYVTTVDTFTYGYNISPAYLTIGRDRDLISGFDIQWVTSRMWSYHNNNCLLELISNNSIDIKYLTSQVNSLNICNFQDLATKVYDDLKECYGEDLIVADSQTDFDYYSKKYDNPNVVIVNNIQKELVLSFSSFKDTLSKMIEKRPLTAEEKYNIWKDKYIGNFLSCKAILELDEIMSEVFPKNEKLEETIKDIDVVSLEI